jgi:hypothetical protein
MLLFRGQLAGLALACISVAAVLSLSCGSECCKCTGPEPTEPHMVYLFREVIPVCEGCDLCGSRYWYFEMSGDSCSYFSGWDPGDGSPEPAWFRAMRPIEVCYDSVDSSCADTSWGYRSDPSLTPRADAEAEEAALWLSGSLVAPEDLYIALLRDLSRIREQYGDSIPQLREVRYTPWEATNKISIKLLPEAYDQYTRGAYYDLDSLNALFHMVTMKPRFGRWFLYLRPEYSHTVVDEVIHDGSFCRVAGLACDLRRAWNMDGIGPTSGLSQRMPCHRSTISLGGFIGVRGNGRATIASS